MKRALPLVMLFLAVVTASAADRFARNAEETSIATTGRIVKIDAKNKTLKIRSSDGQAFSVRSVSQNFAQVMQGLKQRIGVVLPGGIAISLPGRGSKSAASSPKPSDDKANPDELTVMTTGDTVFQDGGDSLKFDDFKTGEMISIHGSLNGTTITASRIAKWF